MLIVVGILLTSGANALSNLVLIDSVVQHWLLATDCDWIAVGLSYESPSMQYKQFPLEWTVLIINVCCILNLICPFYKFSSECHCANRAS